MRKKEKKCSCNGEPSSRTPKDKQEQKEAAMELVKKFPATTNMFSDYQSAVWR